MAGRILVGRAEVALPTLEPESVHLVVTSPPYNVDIDYDASDDLLSESQYWTMIWDVMSGCWRALAPGGRLCWNVVYYRGRGEAGGDGADIFGPRHEEMLMELPGAYCRGSVIWHKLLAASPMSSWGSWMSPSNPVMRDEHEMVYVVSKGPGRKDRSGPGDISREDFLRATRSVWEISAASPKTVGHPVPFPPELVRRLVQLYSWPGDVVLDPFLGSGTTGLVAESLGREWVGIEVSRSYAELALERTTLFPGVAAPSLEVVGDPN